MADEHEGQKKQRIDRWRRFDYWAMWAWLTVGSLITYLLRNEVAWTNFMSLYACVGMHLVGWRADDS